MIVAGQRLDTVSAMFSGQIESRAVSAELTCGVAAGPCFVSAFTAIGGTRAAYEWRRHAVSSLADGRGGWLQRANFIVTGSLYCIAAHGLARSSRPGGPRVVPVLTFGAGGGLICSGLFVTDPVAWYPPSPSDHNQPDRTPPVAPSRAGRLHNLSAIPIFFGTDSGPDLREVRGAPRGVSLGFVFRRLRRCDDDHVRVVRRSVRRCAAL